MTVQDLSPARYNRANTEHIPNSSTGEYNLYYISLATKDRRKVPDVNDIKICNYNTALLYAEYITRDIRYIIFIRPLIVLWATYLYQSRIESVLDNVSVIW